MKTSSKILMLGLLLFPMFTFAQNATEKREFEVEVEWEDMQGYSEMVPYKVPIYYDNDDNVIKHGPLKINYKHDLTSVVQQKCIIAYTVSGNYVNGKLDGVFSLEKSMTLQMGVLKVKGTLNFVNGEPDGTWTFTETASGGGKTESKKLVMVFKDKKLVSANLNNGKECFTISNNTFSGTYDGQVYKNGVNTSEFIRKTGEKTKPDANVTSLINGLIAGTLSESDLIAQGFALERSQPWRYFDYKQIRHYISYLTAAHFMDNDQYNSYSSAIYEIEDNNDINPALTLMRVNVKSAEEMVSIANTIKTAEEINEGAELISWYENGGYYYYYNANHIEISYKHYYFTDEVKQKFTEALKAILAEREALMNKKILEDCVNFIKESFEKCNTLSAYEYQSSSGSSYFEVKNTQIFPIISYEILGIEKSDDPNVTCVVKARVNVGIEQEISLRDIFGSSARPKSSAYSTYDVVVRATYNNGYVRAYLDENYVKIRNDYDVINDLDVKIEENDKLIKELAKTTFKSNYKAYKTYAKDRKLSINDEDLKSSIKEREEAVAVQEAALKFIELIEKLLTGDADMASKCKDSKIVKAYSTFAKTRDLSWSQNWSQEKLESYISIQENTVKFDELLDQIRRTDAEITAKLSDKKDMLKAYSAYAKTRDLSWSSDWSQEKIDGYFSVQNKCMEFNELRNCINNNTAKINSFKSVAPTIVKAYATYSANCDLAWNPDVNFAAANSLIEIQERCLDALNKQGVSDFDKKVKKQKMKNLLEILDVL